MGFIHLAFDYFGMSPSPYEGRRSGHASWEEAVGHPPAFLGAGSESWHRRGTAWTPFGVAGRLCFRRGRVIDLGLVLALGLDLSLILRLRLSRRRVCIAAGRRRARVRA